MVKSVAEIDHVMQAGNKNRAVGATLMNMESSRSHSIFTIVVETSDLGVDGEQQCVAARARAARRAAHPRRAAFGWAS